MAATHALSALTLGPVCAEQGARRNASSFVAASIPAASMCGGGAPRGRLQIRCARMGGVEIPNAKRVETSLKYSHGVGGTTARQILLDVGIENKSSRRRSSPPFATRCPGLVVRLIMFRVLGIVMKRSMKDANVC